ncbi:DUF222 domain-containing protein [Glycomyces sp. TRM65418]|uniref:HNH endonuclease signature motif containing protein n=1 Tax=Glycomyces sp. TRM65418 TaxID=2867006 RepID=UPI001CE4D46E|nr:HNH endonuclease signature motif containing protein [Glycomyces sp. TRM65418]MCC3762809.1 DUF222 domain-containing protein [Glycomyces sp. TRM65418]QZD56838.1 DUF222 domain-containing protein [Glycomyces sp. TRM65418]
MATAALTGTDKHSQAQAIRSALDDAAALINAQHAAVLSAVIEAKEGNLHRDVEGFSALRDWLVSKFDFHTAVTADIAAIARLSGKFTLLAQAAATGKARIDQVAYAVRQLDKTPAMRLFARVPFRAPVASPFDAAVECGTPEALIAQYCAQATFKELQRHLWELEANLADEAEVLDGLGEESLQWLEVTPQGNGMWALSGELSEATGRLLDKYLKTACPPPRQEETDTDGTLPAAPNRHAEALHQLLAGYGTSPEAVKRHGHTATLDLTVDIETLQGKDTGRLPLLEGKPISVAKARLLACEAGIIPSVFNYATGEAIELGRAMRLPNTALRRKLELEQPEGCAWHGCDRPVAWTEAHHLRHWADGGKTVAENLILLCRFHHGRIHTTGWSVEKTGPGQAIITHHEDHEATPADMAETGCGCSDWRTDADLDADFKTDIANVFPTGLFPQERGPKTRDLLNERAAHLEQTRCMAAIKQAKAKCREKFAKPEPKAESEPERAKAAMAAPDHGAPPFLGRPSWRRPGRGREAHYQAHSMATHASQPETLHGSGHFPMPGNRIQWEPAGRSATEATTDLVVAARPSNGHHRTRKPNRPGRSTTHPVVAACSNRDPLRPGEPRARPGKRPPHCCRPPEQWPTTTRQAESPPREAPTSLLPPA